MSRSDATKISFTICAHMKQRSSSIRSLAPCVGRLSAIHSPGTFQVDVEEHRETGAQAGSSKGDFIGCSRATERVEF